MQEFSKALNSYLLAQSLFAVKQVGNLLAPRGREQSKGPVTLGFDSMTDATLDQLGAELNAVFQAFDRTQRIFVGLLYDTVLPFIIYGNDPRRAGVEESQEQVLFTPHGRQF